MPAFYEYATEGLDTKVVLAGPSRETDQAIQDYEDAYNDGYVYHRVITAPTGDLNSGDTIISHWARLVDSIAIVSLLKDAKYEEGTALLLKAPTWESLSDIVLAEGVY